MIILHLLPVWAITDLDDFEAMEAYEQSMKDVIFLIGAISQSMRNSIATLLVSLEAMLWNRLSLKEVQDRPFDQRFVCQQHWGRTRMSFNRFSWLLEAMGEEPIDLSRPTCLASPLEAEALPECAPLIMNFVKDTADFVGSLLFLLLFAHIFAKT